MIGIDALLYTWHDIV